MAMVGIAMAPYAMRSFTGLRPGDTTIEVTELTVGVVTLVLIMGSMLTTEHGVRCRSLCE